MSLRLHPAIFFLVIGIAFTLLLEGCKGGGSGGGNGATPRPPGTVSGTAFDGLVRNGTVNVWSFNGTSGAHLGSGTTDNEGHYSLSITAESQPVLIEVTGGTYTEEASGKTVTLNAQANKLLAVANYTSGKALSTSVTYYTTLATGLAQYLIKSGMPVAQAVSKANTRMGELAGVNIANVVPVDITSISSAKPSLDDALRYSFATAAISELTKQQSLKAYPTENVHERHTSIGWVTLAYHDIVYDGVLNGKGAAGTISIGSIPITTKMYRHDTAIAMLVIASSTNNKTSIKVSELRSDAARFAQSTDVIFDGATPPPFLDGAGAGPKITLSFSKPLTGNVDVVPQIALLDDVRLDSAKLTIGSVDFGSAANPANVKWSADTTQVTDGTHTLKIVVADAIGRTTTFQTSVTVSNGKIVISQSPAADSAVRGTIPFVFTPRTATGLSITGVSISTSAIGTVALSANGDGTWRYDLNSQVFSDGKQSFTVRANDSAGRHTTVTFDLFVDNTAPTITHTIPSGFTSGDLAATIGITETNLANASYKLDGQNAVALKVGDNAVNIPAGTLNGTQKLTIEATDKAGNLTRVTHNFNADNTAPVITHTAPSGYTAGDLRFTITVTETNLDKASYAIGNARPVSLNTGSNAITVSKGDLSDGTHTLVIEASDKAGATAKVTHTLLVDNVAPKIAHTAPSGYTSGDITFTITVTETNLDKATYKIGTGNDIALNAGSNTITLSKGTLIDGDHTLTMTATDKAGTKTTVTHTLKVDNNAPTIAHTAPSAYTAGAIAFTITVTEDYLDKASYTIGSRSAVNLKAGANNVTLSAGTLADGSHTLTITATDKAGAKTTATHTLNVDNTRPVVSTNLSAAWQRGSIQLVTTITESHLTSATVTIDGTLIGKAVAGKTGFTINTTVYSDGQHTVVVKATDKAGRSTSHSATLNVDNTAPVITIGYPIANSLMGGDFTYKARIKELHSGLDKSSEQVFIDNQQIDTAGLVCTPAVGASIPCDKPDRTANHHPGTTKTHTIEIRARDKAGNVGSARIYNVTFDNAPPTLLRIQKLNHDYVRYYYTDAGLGVASPNYVNVRYSSQTTKNGKCPQGHQGNKTNVYRHFTGPWVKDKAGNTAKLPNTTILAWTRNNCYIR